MKFKLECQTFTTISRKAITQNWDDPPAEISFDKSNKIPFHY